MQEICPPIKTSIGRTGGGLTSLLLAGAASLVLSGPAHATLTIIPTFDSSITSLPGAAAIEGAINNAISAVTTNITSPNNITVSIDFQNMSTGLGESTTGFYNVGYSSFRSAFAAVATQPNQLTALASLPNTANNPVTNNANLLVTSAEGRNLGFNTPGIVNGTFDTLIGLNTSITFPPGSNNGSNYFLQAVANHEIDESLGIGGAGSTVGEYRQLLLEQPRRSRHLPLYGGGRSYLYDYWRRRLVLHQWRNNGFNTIQSGRGGLGLRGLAHQWDTSGTGRGWHAGCDSGPGTG